jgi:hypothetical protein
MANVLFISETFLKQNTQVSDNVDVKYILGTTLYNKIKTDIAASNLAGVYLTLLEDYIQICLKHYVTAECLAMAEHAG